FDFVVYHSSNDIPVFALEIDGPSHESARQAGLDITKNRLCAKAELPLLRLGMDVLDETAAVVLAWLVERFVVWQDQTPAYRADVLSRLTHHIATPFPLNQELLTELFNDWRIM